MIKTSTRLIDLTVGELRGLFAELARPAQPTEDRKVVTDFTDTKYVVGIAGVAKALGIGKTKAQQLVNDDKFAPAIIHPCFVSYNFLYDKNQNAGMLQESGHRKIEVIFF